MKMWAKSTWNKDKATWPNCNDKERETKNIVVQRARLNVENYVLLNLTTME